MCNGSSSLPSKPVLRVGTTTNYVSVGSTHASVPTTTPIVTTGEGQPHENRPPYYALAYIMKLSN